MCVLGTVARCIQDSVLLPGCMKLQPVMAAESMHACLFWGPQVRWMPSFGGTYYTTVTP
jgi:hypothetical protein